MTEKCLKTNPFVGCRDAGDAAEAMVPFGHLTKFDLR